MGHQKIAVIGRGTAAASREAKGIVLPVDREMRPERILKMGFVIALLAAAAELSGCESRSVTGPEEEGQLTMMVDKIYVVSDRDSVSLVEASDSLLVFDMSGSVPPIPRGSVVFGTENGGYAREAISTAVSGRRLFVRTKQGFLTDVVIRGRIDTTMTLGFGSSVSARRTAERRPDADLVQSMPGVAESENGLDLSGVVLFSGTAGGSDASVTITRGRIEFDPELELFAAIRTGKLAEFHAIAEGMLRLDCDVEVQSSGAIELAREMTIASMSETVIQHIRSIPVVEVIRLSFIASFDISSKFVGACGIGLQSAARMKFGPRFDGGAWAYVAQVAPTFTAQAIHYESPEEADIKVFITPRVDVELYGLPCAHAAFGPHFGLTEQKVGFPVLEWEMRAGMNGDVGFSPGALARVSRPYDAFPFCCDTTLGSGPYRTDSYIFVAQWGSAGVNDGQFGYPKGIAADKEGNVYVVDNWNNNVQEFSPDGAFLLKWGTSGTGEGQFDSPEKLAIDDSGDVYVVDGGNHRVQKFAPGGTFMAKWGSQGSGDGQFQSPEGIAVSGASVFVADNAGNRVQKFSTLGSFIGAWGSYGGGDGQFDGAAGVAANALQGFVLVSDCRNGRIQKFSSDGAFAASWGSSGSGAGQFDCPVDVAIGPDGTVLVTDIGNDRVVRLTPAGDFMTEVGSTGTAPGEFDHPEGAAVDAQGNLYVIDARNARIQKFAPRAAGVTNAGRLGPILMFRTRP